MKNLLKLLLLVSLGVLFLSALFCIANNYLAAYMIPGIWYGYFPVIGIVTGNIYGRFSSVKGGGIFFTTIIIGAIIYLSHKLILPCDSTFHAIPPLVLTLIFTLTAEAMGRTDNRRRRKTSRKIPPAS